MTFLNSKSGIEKVPAPVWFVVEHEGYGAIAQTRVQREDAIADFSRYIAQAAQIGEGYTPFQNGRRIYVVGPDVHVRAEDDDAVLYLMPDDEAEDPLLYGDVALRAVLDADEYALYVQKPVASALLES